MLTRHTPPCQIARFANAASETEIFRRTVKVIPLRWLPPVDYFLALRRLPVCNVRSRETETKLQGRGLLLHDQQNQQSLPVLAVGGLMFVGSAAAQSKPQRFGAGAGQVDPGHPRVNQVNRRETNQQNASPMA